ncbi:DUF3303 domain-containing protein [Aquabacterium humicola]|uniref:DUF3303 domain-containing protein n=1 Tax=Aquabacterium humicola TaxID=3237377 RepID=UPI0032EF4382
MASLHFKRRAAQDQARRPSCANGDVGWWSNAAPEESNAAGKEHMLFMVIERFVDDDMLPVYERVGQAGRGLPTGLTYIDSWVEPSFERCFQLMECSDCALLQEWVLHWRGTGMTFEIVPVVKSVDTSRVVTTHLERSRGSQSPAAPGAPQRRRRIVQRTSSR